MSKFCSFLLLSCVSFVIVGCGVEAAKNDGVEEKKTSTTTVVTQNSQSKPTIEIKPNSPADTVRAFYKNLRDKKVRDAIFLTNLRPAIEGLTDVELKELQVDFDSLAQDVPAEIQINGEIITGDKAVVTANLPDEKKQLKIQEIKLLKEGDAWIIKTVEGETEKLVKREGSKYFFAVRLKAYEEEAKEMLDRLAKAQIALANSNGGAYADQKGLVEKSFLPANAGDISGYKYSVNVAADRKKYTVNAEPVEYGKTGKLSFLLEGEEGKTPRITSGDTGGKPVRISTK